MLGNTVYIFLLQNRNYFERVQKTPSVTSEIILIFFSVLEAHHCYIKKEKIISSRLRLTVPNKYTNFVGLVGKP